MEDTPSNEQAKTFMIGHILIRDKDTHEVIVNQRDTLVHQRSLGNDDAG